MIKVFCIDNQYYEDMLDIGKIYDAELVSNRYSTCKQYTISDNGIEFYLCRERFITLAEWRNNQINSILDGND
jgi:hypothetical protein